MQIKSAEEYAICLIGLLGEIPSLAIADIKGIYTGKYLRNTFFKLAEDGYVKKVKLNGKIYFRLKSPKGTMHLKTLSNSLYMNYLLLTSTSLNGQARYLSGDRLNRLRNQVLVLLELYNAGISINCFNFVKDPVKDSLSSQTVFDEKSSQVLRYSEIRHRLEEDKLVFVTSQVLNERGNISAHARDTNSRKMGLLKGEGDYFLTYMLNEPDYRWFIETEKNNRSRFEKDTGSEVKGLFIAKDKEIYEKALKPDRVISSVCQPLMVYDNANILLLGSTAALKLLALNNHQDKVNEVLLEKLQGYFDIKPDGLLEGEPVFNFLLGDMKRLKAAKESIRFYGKGKVLVCSYQVKAVLNYLGFKENKENEVLIILPDEILSSLAERLLGKDKDAKVYTAD